MKNRQLGITLVALLVAIVALLMWFANRDSVTVPALVDDGPASEVEEREVPTVDAVTERRGVDAGDRYALVGRARGDARAKITGAVVRAYAGQPLDQPAMLAGALAAWIDRDHVRAPVLEPGGTLLAEARIRPAGAGSVDGVFEFDGLSARHVRLTIEHDYYALPAPVPVHVPTDAARFEVGELEPFLGGRVRGRVRGEGAKRGIPILLVAEFEPISFLVNPSQIVSIGLRRGKREQQLGSEHAFDFRAVWPSEEARLSVRNGDDFAAAGPFEVIAGETHDVDLALKRGAALAVRVVDDRGEPIAGARVRARAAFALGLFGSMILNVEAHTDERGRCALRGLSRTQHEIAVRAAGFLSTAREVEVPMPDGAVFEIAMRPGGIIEGRVVDAEGNGIVDAGVAWHESIKLPVLGDLSAFLGEELLSASAIDSDTRTDADGRFRLGGIAPSADAVTLVADHPEFAGGVSPNVKVGSRSAEIVLQQHASIVGRVLDADTGAPVSDFTVETRVPMALFMDRPSRAIAIAESDDGVFELPRVPAARALLRIVANGFAPHEQRVRTKPGEALDVGDVALTTGVTVRGTVTDEDGNPVEEAAVRRKVRGLGDNALFAPLLRGPAVHTDADGHFELVCQQPGRFVLTAVCDGFARGESERLNAKSGDALDGITIRLGSGGVIEGELLLPVGADYADWVIIPESHACGAARLARPADDGSFRIEALDPGRYNVSAFNTVDAPGILARVTAGRNLAGFVREMLGTVVLQVCTVRAGEVSEVVLDARSRASRGNEIRGTVTLAGDPLADGWIETRRADGPQGVLPMAVVRDGAFTLAGAAPGRYTLQVRRGLLMAPVSGPRTIEVPAGAGFSIELDLPGGSIAGRVIHDGSGEPLEGAVVKILGGDRKHSGADPVEFGFELTGKDGGFRFVGLEPGVYSLVADEHMSPTGASARAGGRLSDLRVDADGELAGLVLRAQPASSVTVRVTDAQGSPVARAMIVTVDREGNSIGTLPLAFTDANGRAHIAGLPPGEIRIVARRVGFSPGHSAVVYASPGRDAECAVTLDRGTRVVVEVVDARGKRYPNAIVSVRPVDGPWLAPGLLQARSRADGRIALGPLRPGKCEFAVAHADLGEFTVERVVPAGSDVTLVLRR